jgi:hypothetical protein
MHGMAYVLLHRKTDIRRLVIIQALLLDAEH